MKAYDQQDRGSRLAYQLYWDGMDKTIPQKLAFVYAHFLLRPGAQIADLGCGSGLGTALLAKANPHAHFVGIDIDPVNIEKGNKEFAAHLPNLTYVLGDMMNLPPQIAGFDGFLNFSVLHHVYSFVPKSYDPANVQRALAHQKERLKTGGMIVIRDFIGWPADQYVYLDLKDGPGGDTPVTMSAPELLLDYSRTAYPLAPERGTGFFVEEVEPRLKRHRSFYLAGLDAVDFVHRKDYRNSYETERLERYVWWTPRECGNVLTGMGLRVQCRRPIYNPWVIDNRMRGQVRLTDQFGRNLGFPPTNYVVVAQKVEEGESLFLREARVATSEPDYLQIRHYKNKKTGRLFSMAARPGGVVDVLPWMWHGQELLVAAKANYPRPIVNTVSRGTENLDGIRLSGHLVEPLALANVEEPASVLLELSRRCSFSAETIKQTQQALTYYPAPGHADELVGSLTAEMSESAYNAADGLIETLDPGLSGFSTSGEIRLYNAQNLLRSAQVGVLPEARLELNIYALMRALGETPHPWLDGDMRQPRASAVDAKSIESLFVGAAEQVFVQTTEDSGYLLHKHSIFGDYSAERELASREFDFVLPAKASANAGLVLPIARDQSGELYMGVLRLDLPAPQNREGASAILTIPTFRLPFKVRTAQQMEAYLARKCGVRRDKLHRLGSSYYSSIGMTPDCQYPFVAFINPTKAPEDLHYLSFSDFFTHFEKLRDASLMIAGLRAVHAFGAWERCAESRRKQKASCLGRKAHL